MKTTPRQLLLAAALACFSGLSLAALAQTAPAPASDQTAAPAPAESAVSTASSSETAAPVAKTDTPAPAAAVAAPPESAPASAASTMSASTASAEPAATPVAPTASPAPAVESTTDTSSLRHLDEAAPAAPASPASPEKPRAPRVHHGDNARVMIFQNSELGKDETADAVVTIFGNANSEGNVADSVVTVCGNAHVTGPVGDAVVVVCGNAYIDSKVREAVAVLGNLELGPHAEVMGDVVNVAGTIKRDPKAVVHGQMPNVGIGPQAFGALDSLQTYLTQCVFKLRPLAFAPNLGWAWALAAGFLVFYVLLALVFRGGIDKCVGTLETRPGGSILAALLTLLLTPVLIVLLVVTVVGIAVIPFLAIALMLAGLFGKATMLAWLGRRITRLFGEGSMNHPAFGVLIGGIIVMLLYAVPVVGFIVYKAFAVLGLGIVVYTLLLASKREKRAAVAAAPGVVSPAGSVGFAAAAPVGGGAAVLAEQVTAPAASVATPASALPRAGFWIRTGALAIDVILGAVVLGVGSDFLRVLHVHNGPGFLLLMLAVYGAVMWKLKGTTIGGIVCGLKVVRLDNRPIDWPTAIVRALGCFLSLVVVGLGFIWAAIDDEKQSWHDKIAGTAVVYARGNVSLV